MPVSLVPPRLGGGGGVVPFKGESVGDRMAHVVPSLRVSCGVPVGVQKGGLTPLEQAGKASQRWGCPHELVTMASWQLPCLEIHPARLPGSSPHPQAVRDHGPSLTDEETEEPRFLREPSPRSQGVWMPSFSDSSSSSLPSGHHDAGGSLRAGGDTESIQVGWASAHRPQARLLKVGREEGGESVLFPSLLVTSVITGSAGRGPVSLGGLFAVLEVPLLCPWGLTLCAVRVRTTQGQAPKTCGLAFRP